MENNILSQSTHPDIDNPILMKIAPAMHTIFKLDKTFLSVPITYSTATLTKQVVTLQPTFPLIENSQAFQIDKYSVRQASLQLKALFLKQKATAGLHSHIAAWKNDAYFPPGHTPKLTAHTLIHTNTCHASLRSVLLRCVPLRLGR